MKQFTQRLKGGLFHRTASKKKPAPIPRPRPDIARPGQAQEGSASENSALVGLGMAEWLGYGAVRRRDGEICGLWKRSPFYRRFNMIPGYLEKLKCY
ncbi:hypothetical protein ACFL9T_10435 [Thermodesulfobacteriota bacterium]